MVKKNSAPNAWEDDDWESQADKEAQEPAAPAAPLTKKERLAQHAELNRKIWESADTPGNGAPLQYLAATPTPPLAQPFKAPMTVLARKPMIAKRDPVTGISSLTMADDDDDEDEANKKPQETPEEIRARQQREREEKQKRYDEMRAKIFGESNTSGSGSGAGRGGSGRSSGTSTPGNVTPPTQRSGGERRGRGRGRGGYRGGRGGGGGGSSGGDAGNDRFADRGGERSEFQRPISQSGGGGGAGASSELYDPSYSPKPNSSFDRRGNNTSGGAPLSGRSTPRDDDQVIRAPRGPPVSGSDNGGRGGFGFAKRGAKEG
ncbi:hypothetical protein PG985_002827 [Apiospora marii]|uniref:SUZ domain-containing protein n=1 Tax=Apiospora marii TaxID=335849 RepID=A0ABR1RU23_9PEZI